MLLNIRGSFYSSIYSSNTCRVITVHWIQGRNCQQNWYVFISVVFQWYIYIESGSICTEPSYHATTGAKNGQTSIDNAFCFSCFYKWQHELVRKHQKYNKVRERTLKKKLGMRLESTDFHIVDLQVCPLNVPLLLQAQLHNLSIPPVIVLLKKVGKKRRSIFNIIVLYVQDVVVTL